MARYCPKCRGEYQDWVDKCVDCGEKLVDRKPEPAPKSDEKSKIVKRGDRSYTKEPIVVLTSFENYMEAELTKGILESEGISSMIVRADTTIASKTGSYDNKGGIDLLVKESELEKAQEILNSIDKNVPEEALPEEFFTEDSGNDDPKAQV
jgi:hypothetical protein